MLIQYVGPSQEVVIAATGQVCPQGEPVEVDDPIAKNLLEQSTWQAAPKPKTTTKPETKE